MAIIKTNFEGVYKIPNFYSKDNRGVFIKSFKKSYHLANNLEFNFTENFFNISKKNVIRGMHFQEIPFDHSKLITVIQGTIIDVILDLRKDSPTYLNTFNTKLSSIENQSLYISKGFAHGFLVTSEQAIVNYLVTSEFNPLYDKVINYNSIDFKWPVKNPILSKKDKNSIKLDDYKSPF